MTVQTLLLLVLGSEVSMSQSSAIFQASTPSRDNKLPSRGCQEGPKCNFGCLPASRIHDDYLSRKFGPICIYNCSAIGNGDGLCTWGSFTSLQQFRRLYSSSKQAVEATFSRGVQHHS